MNDFSLEQLNELVYCVGRMVAEDRRNKNAAYGADTRSELLETLTKQLENCVAEEMPAYVKCVERYGRAVVGEVYSTSNDDLAERLFMLPWRSVLIKFGHLGTKFKPCRSGERVI